MGDVKDSGLSVEVVVVEAIRERRSFLNLVLYALAQPHLPIVPDGIHGPSMLSAMSGLSWVLAATQNLCLDQSHEDVYNGRRSHQFLKNRYIQSCISIKTAVIIAAGGCQVFGAAGRNAARYDEKHENMKKKKNRLPLRSIPNKRTTPQPHHLHKTPSHPQTRHLSTSPNRNNNTTTHPEQIQGYPADPLNAPLTKPNSRPPDTKAPPSSRSQTLARARLVFGDRAAEAAERKHQRESRSQLISGILVPPKPSEPDNCCMSGCVNCVWERFREEVEEYRMRMREAKRRQEGGEGEVEEDEGLEGIPIGIREFMKTEKRLKERRGDRTLGFLLLLLLLLLGDDEICIHTLHYLFSFLDVSQPAKVC
ncbi:uncharacterized protein MYCFIDRAFT_180011 [Pseudocercospora fijiensis CIRAD86]|uniref:Oxidoreductase-like domain-containing protein n=1 Tax=Pseudocercospora fijiensis (strain CIRAD86) TaxID=383855 RepID=M2ZE93_PSEFD|nr:uncharacterized protein MYCFIDRAFT_180011 [Pseudocercospora fijiensis CIRAD86]EME77449.1 hypothetical protein MYCFIDRAFT_180011 [Pseudocercospora fijiensis CIRAD86]